MPRTGTVLTYSAILSMGDDLAKSKLNGVIEVPRLQTTKTLKAQTLIVTNATLEIYKTLSKIIAYSLYSASLLEHSCSIIPIPR